MENLYIDNWAEYFIRHCYLTSYKSRDTSSKIGSVIVNPESNSIISEGYNSPCRGINDQIKERYERPLKYAFFEHSERNAVFNCARNGQSTLNCHLYTLSLSCCDCTRAIIQSGLSKIIIHKQWYDEFKKVDRWKDSLNYSLEMFNEAKIEIIEFDKILGLKSICNGKIIEI